MLVRCRIQPADVAVCALIDTGCSQSLMSAEVFFKLGERVQRLSAPIRLRLADGNLLEPMGWQELQLDFGAVKLKQRLLIVRGLAKDLLLGADFLQNSHCLIDCSQRVVSICGHQVRFVESSSPGVFAVEAAARTIVQPGHEVVFPARLITNNVPDIDGAIGVFEPSDAWNIASVVCGARTLSTCKDGLISVRYINTDSQPHTLRLGTRLGNFEMLEEEVMRVDEEDQLTHAPKIDIDEANLTKEQLIKTKELLQQYGDVFSENASDLGCTSLLKHNIDTGTARPIRVPPRRLAPPHQRVVAEMVNDMVKQGVVEPSNSPWSSPVVLVKKRDGTLRFVNDFRLLNSLTVKDSHPLPHTTDLIDALGGSTMFSTLDFTSGYSQVLLDSESREKTAFPAPQGLFQYKRMPQGICNGPATFSRLMELVLKGLRWEICLSFLDDVVVFSRGFDEHISRLRTVLQKFREANLKLKPSKCHLCCREIKFLGFCVSKDGISTDPEKVRAVEEWPQPQNRTEIRQFLGLCGYYRQFVRGYSSIAEPLYRLTQKDVEFRWSDDCEGAFRKLKTCLTTSPVLVIPTFSPDSEFVLDTDASAVAISGILQERRQGRTHVVAYGSRTLTKAERNYCTTRRELLAVVHFVKNYRSYLMARPFILRTDHSSLTHLLKFKAPDGQLARWLQQLGEFDFKMEYRRGEKHVNADALSRRPCRQGPCVCHEAATMSVELGGGENEVRQAQQADKCVRRLLAGVRAGERPGEVETSAWSERERRLLADFNRLSEVDGLLCRRWESDDGEMSWRQLLIPWALRRGVFDEAHAGTSGSHCGAEKTLERIRARFFWPGMTTDVSDWCSVCAVCAQLKDGGRQRRAPMQPMPVGRVGQRVEMDFMTGLPRTERGNCVIMVIIDTFSKWTEAFALPSQDAETSARTFVNEWVTRYGVPEAVHTDQGRNWESLLFKETMRLLNVAKTRTTAYHAQSDGGCERVNRTIIQLLRVWVQENPREWDLHLSIALMGYRSSVHRATGQTPSAMHFGRELRLPLDVAFGLSSSTTDGTNKWTVDLRQRLQRSHDLARKALTATQKQQKVYYDRRCHGGGFSEGDRVWLHNPALRTGESAKFHCWWTGPWTVKKRLSECVYRIQMRRRRRVVHFNRLKPCIAEVSDPKQQNGETSENGQPTEDSQELVIVRTTQQNQQLQQQQRQDHPRQHEQHHNEQNTQQDDQQQQVQIMRRSERTRRPPQFFGEVRCH